MPDIKNRLVIDRMKGVASRDSLIYAIQEAVNDLLIIQNETERAVNYSALMDKAREFEYENETAELVCEIMKNNGEPEPWEIPKEFEKPKYDRFPIDQLPDVLREYVVSCSKTLQVHNELMVFPVLSIVSACLQKRVIVQNPRSPEHRVTTDCYFLTVHGAGEKKSPAGNLAKKPYMELISRKNKSLINAVAESSARYETKKKMLEKAKTKGNEQEAVKLQKEIDNYKSVEFEPTPLDDTTTEAFVLHLMRYNGIATILSTEGELFPTISGTRYGKGNASVSAFLNAYDNDHISLTRVTREKNEIEFPSCVIGLMTQPLIFERAMRNRDFLEKGFLARFMFCFPESKGLNLSEAPPIQEEVKENYVQTLERLYRMPTAECKNDMPILYFDNLRDKRKVSAKVIAMQYYEHTETEQQPGKLFNDEYKKAWMSKQYTRFLKISGMLHLCEHTETEKINALAAFRAMHICIWLENQALRAFNNEAFESENTKMLKYILEKLKKWDKPIISLRELQRECRKLETREEVQEYIETLVDMRYLRPIESDRKNKLLYKISPFCARFEELSQDT